MATKPVIIATAVILISFTHVSNSQPSQWSWAKQLGGNNASNMISWSVVSDLNENTYLSGWFFGTCDFDPGPAVHSVAAGGNGAIFITKLDSAGNFIWVKSFGGTASGIDSWDLELSYTGNAIYLTGDFEDTIDFNPGPGVYNLVSNGLYDGFICSLDNAGNFLWAKNFGGANNEGATSITIDNSFGGGVYVTGWFYDTADFNPNPSVNFDLISAGSTDIFILKLDILSGNFVWAQRFGGVSDDGGESIVVDPAGSGNLYVIGNFSDTVDFDVGPGSHLLSTPTSAMFILNSDQQGDFGWAKQVECLGQSLTIDPSGNKDIYVSGLFGGPIDMDPDSGVFTLNGYGVFILKLNESGNFSWAKGIETINSCIDCKYTIAVSDQASEGVFITGAFESTTDFDPGPGITNLTPVFDDAFLLKLNAQGDFSWVKQISGSQPDFGSRVFVSQTRVIVTGWFNSPSLAFDSITILNNSNTNHVFISSMPFDHISGEEEIAKDGSEIRFYFLAPKNELIIQMQNVSRNCLATICDLAGRPRISKKFSGRDLTIDTSVLSTGIYLMNITGERGRRS